MIEKLRAVPPMAWVGFAILGGMAAIAYHQFSQNPDDGAWTIPSGQQPPPMAPYSCVPCQPSPNRPMDPGPAFRSRAYADTLTKADFSFIGGIDVG
jgi:hypothetical protein